MTTSIEPDIRADDLIWLSEQADAIRANLRAAGEHFLDTGRRLLGVKKRTKGGFVAWVKSEFPLSVATAERYMQAAEYVTQNPQAAELPLTVLCLLGSSKTPPEAVAEVNALVAAGKTLSLQEAREVVESHADPEADTDVDDDEACLKCGEATLTGHPLCQRCHDINEGTDDDLSAPIAADAVEFVSDDKPARPMRPERKAPDPEPVKVAERKPRDTPPPIPSRVQCEHCGGKGYVSEAKP